MKQPYGTFGQSNIHHTLDFCLIQVLLSNLYVVIVGQLFRWNGIKNISWTSFTWQLFRNKPIHSELGLWLGQKKCSTQVEFSFSEKATTSLKSLQDQCGSGCFEIVKYIGIDMPLVCFSKVIFTVRYTKTINCPLFLPLTNNCPHFFFANNKIHWEMGLLNSKEEFSDFKA